MQQHVMPTVLKVLIVREQLQDRIDSSPHTDVSGYHAAVAEISESWYALRIGDIQVWMSETDSWEDDLNVDFCWDQFQQHIKGLSLFLDKEYKK